MTNIIYDLQGKPPVKGVPYIGGKDKVVACAKHFVSDGGNTLSDYKGLMSIHMLGYYHSIIKGVSTIMVSYSSWNGVKMHSNKNLVTQFLKTTLRFRNLYILVEGFAISDWQGVDRMTYPCGSNYTNSLQSAINVGVDMVCIFIFRLFVQLMKCLILV